MTIHLLERPSTQIETLDPAATYRKEALRLLGLAASSPFEEIRHEFVELARRFEALAAHVDFCTRRGF